MCEKRTSPEQKLDHEPPKSHDAEKWANYKKMRFSNGNERLRDILAQRNSVIRFLMLVTVILALANFCDRQPPQAAIEPDWTIAEKVYDDGCFVVAHNGSVEPFRAADMFVRASQEAGLDYPANHEVLLALALHESTFWRCMRPRIPANKPDWIGKSGERGYLQIHPVHFKPMRAAGLDPTDEYDLVLYGALIIRWEMDKGSTLYHAMRPWTTRAKAWNTLKEIRE
jgi:hypothetical protein